MTFEDSSSIELTTIEAIVRVSRGRLASTSADEVAFRQAVNVFLEATADVGRAIGVVMMVAEGMGFVTRDHEGRWETRAETAAAAAAADAGPDGQAEIAAIEAASRAMPSGPATIDVEARRKAKHDIFAEVFSFELSSGRAIGTLRYSELSHVETLAQRDSRILRRVRQHAVPAADQLISEYFPPTKLQKIIREETNRASH